MVTGKRGGGREKDRWRRWRKALVVWEGEEAVMERWWRWRKRYSCCCRICFISQLGGVKCLPFSLLSEFP